MLALVDVEVRSVCVWWSREGVREDHLILLKDEFRCHTSSCKEYTRNRRKLHLDA